MTRRPSPERRPSLRRHALVPDQANLGSTGLTASSRLVWPTPAMCDPADRAEFALAAIRAFAADLPPTADAAAIGARLHEALASLVAYDAIALYLPAPHGRALELRYAASRLGRDEPTPIDLDSDMVEAQCLATGETVDEDADAVPVGGETPALGGACRTAFPLLAATAPLGVVSLTRGEPLCEADCTLAATLISMAAVCLAASEAASFGKMMRDVIESSDEAISLYDENARVLYSNPAYHRIFVRYPPPDLLRGMTHEELYRIDVANGDIEDPVARWNPEAYVSDRGRIFRDLRGELREVQTVRGRTYLYVRTRSAAGATMSRRVDITEMVAVEAELRAAQHRLEQIAFTDSLTGLPNRRRFRAVFDEMIESCGNGGPGLAVIFFDLDHFKDVNDTLGHSAGDRLLVEVAKRLQSCAAPHLVFRFGGDEFSVLWDERIAVESLGSAVARIQQAIAAPYDIEGRVLTITASIGLARATQDGRTADDVLKKADLALYRAKAAGRAVSRQFDEAMDAELQERRRLAMDVREALGRRQFELYFQPVIDLRSFAPTGVETLLRWRHPERGMVSPAVFVPLLEELGLIGALGDWLLHQACAAGCDLPDGLGIAVNISPRQFGAGDLVEAVRQATTQSGLDPSRLEIEVTESVLLRNDPAVLETLDALRRMRVRLALDDFGTGYSSMSYLCRFPFTRLKIDQSFVAGITERRDCRAVVRAAVELGRQLDVATTAEGVETEEQLRCVREAGCDAAQGFLIAKPMPMAQVVQWLASRDAARQATAPTRVEGALS